MDSVTSVYVSRKFECPIDELFNWLVTPKLIAKWFGPKQFSVIQVSNNLIIGGSYKIELAKSPDQTLLISGSYLQIEIPNKLVFSFRYSGIQNAPPESVVIIDLEKVDAWNTNLFLRQKFSSQPSDLEQRDKAWGHMLSKLSQKLLS